MKVRIEVYGFPGEIFPETLEWFTTKLDSLNVEVVYPTSWGSGAAVLITSDEPILVRTRADFMKLIQEQQNSKTTIRFIESQPTMTLQVSSTQSKTHSVYLS